MSEQELRNLGETLIKNNTISPDYYKQFDVKRGLRNADGTGVLSGLTHISSVVGSVKSEFGLNPVEGILKYRGISLADIVASHDDKSSHFFEKVCFYL